MTRIARVRDVRLDDLAPSERRELEGELADIYLASFVGPTREQTIESFVRRGPNLRLRVFVGADGGVIGFVSSSISKQRLGGRELAVHDGGIYVRAGVRGGGALGMRICLVHCLGYLLRHPRTPLASVGLALTPVGYHRLLESIPDLLPRPGVAAPPEIEAQIRELLPRRGWVPVGGDPWVVRRTHLLVRPREPERLSRSALLEQPGPRYYIERNPGYEAGDAMVIHHPVGVRSLGRTIAKILRQRS